jgi:coproporphyrinogen III oxidase-like Fe-S oxidoreductase
MLSARADDLLASAEVLPAMAAVRMLRVSVGVETLSGDGSVRIGKSIPSSLYCELFERMRELRMFSVASLIVGLPGESAADRMRSVELAVEAGPDSAQFVPFQPLPGIPLAGGRADVRPEDIRDAQAFTKAFFAHPRVRARLAGAVRSGGIRGLLAEGARRKHTGPGAGRETAAIC